MSYGPPEINAVVDDRGNVTYRRSVIDPVVGYSAVPVAVSVDDLARINSSPHFLYMDVGMWGENTKTFGVMHADGQNGFAAICSYESSADRARIVARIQESGIDPGTEFTNFLVQCKGVILKNSGPGGQVKLFRTPPGVNTQGRIYLFLGDLHLPIVTQTHHSPLPNGRLLGDRISFSNIDAMFQAHLRCWSVMLQHGILASYGRASHVGISPGNWLSLYYDADIFGNAAPALYQFLTLLEGWSGTPIHFFQVGDMFEFWIGLQCLFQEDTTGHNVILHNQATSLTIVREWVASVNRSFSVGQQSLLGKLHNLSVPHKTWIYGNHDNYMRVLTAPGTRTGTDPPRRMMNFFQHGVQVEHGHFGDEYNIDGELSGWEITQLAYVERRVRHIQSLWDAISGSTRNIMLGRGVNRYLHHRPSGQAASNMKAFVMAHTHSPYMTNVVVS